MGDFFQKRAADPKTEKNTRQEEEIEQHGWTVQETELPAERKLGDVDGEVEPCPGADHDHFGLALGKKIEGGDGTGGIGQHGGDAGRPTATQAQQRVSGDPIEKLGAKSLQKNNSDQNKDDPAQRMAEKFGRDVRHDPPTGEDADQGGRQKGAKHLPRRVFVKGEDPEDVCKDQKGKDDSGGLAGWKHFGHQDHGEKAERTEARLGQARADGGEGGEEPGMGGEVGHGDSG